MGYLEYLKLNPDYEATATATAADALRRAGEPAVPGCDCPHFASMTLRQGTGGCQLLSVALVRLRVCRQVRPCRWACLIQKLAPPRSYAKVQSGFGYPTPVSGGTVETGNCLSTPLHATERPRHFPRPGLLGANPP
jgi:hypothetical protein